MSSFQLGEVEPFEWPEITATRREWVIASRSAFKVEADTSQFANWLWQIGECYRLTWPRLQILYEEYCAMNGLAPTPFRTLQTQLNGAGFVRHREKKKRKGQKQRNATFYSVDLHAMARPKLSRVA